MAFFTELGLIIFEKLKKKKKTLNSQKSLEIKEKSWRNHCLCMTVNLVNSPGLRVARWVAKHCFQVYSWGCFWQRLAFGSGRWSKECPLTNVSTCFPVSWKLGIEPKVKEGQSTLTFWAGTSISSLPWDIRTSGSQDFRLGLNYATSFSASAWRWPSLGLLCPYKPVSQFLQYIFRYVWKVMVKWSCVCLKWINVTRIANDFIKRKDLDS